MARKSERKMLFAKKKRKPQKLHVACTPAEVKKYKQRFIAQLEKGRSPKILPQLGTEIVTSEMLLRSQRKLHHAFQELVRRQANEVVHDELLGVEADEVAQLQRLAARGIDEIPVPVVDHDDVALGI